MVVTEVEVSGPYTRLCRGGGGGDGDVRAVSEAASWTPIGDVRAGDVREGGLVALRDASRRRCSDNLVGDGRQCCMGSFGDVATASMQVNRRRGGLQGFDALPNPSCVVYAQLATSCTHTQKGE
jgi:hypothetical protein